MKQRYLDCDEDGLFTVTPEQWKIFPYYLGQRIVCHHEGETNQSLLYQVCRITYPNEMYPNYIIGIAFLTVQPGESK